MEIIESIAYITCGCGQKFQVIKEVHLDNGESYLDCDMEATDAEYQAHQPECPLNAEV